MEEVVKDYQINYRPSISLLQKVIWMLPFSRQYIPNFKFLKGFIKKKGKMLDIGSSAGKFMYLMKLKGWQVLGIEPTTNYADFANKCLKVKTINSYIEDYETEEKFDFINLSAVLEHVSRPDLIIKKVSKWLTNEGFMFICVPLDTAESSRAKTHFYLFSSISFNKLMDKMNLDIIKKELVVGNILAIVKLKPLSNKNII